MSVYVCALILSIVCILECWIGFLVSQQCSSATKFSLLIDYSTWLPATNLPISSYCGSWQAYSSQIWQFLQWVRSRDGNVTSKVWWINSTISFLYCVQLGFGHMSNNFHVSTFQRVLYTRTLDQTLKLLIQILYPHCNYQIKKDHQGPKSKRKVAPPSKTQSQPSIIITISLLKWYTDIATILFVESGGIFVQSISIWSHGGLLAARRWRGQKNDNQPTHSFHSSFPWGVKDSESKELGLQKIHPCPDLIFMQNLPTGDRISIL